MNIGCLSDNDGEGNENNPSCQNKCAVFCLFCFVVFFLCVCFNFFAFISVNSLKMAKMYTGELPQGVLGTAPKFELGEEIELNLSLSLRPSNNVAKGKLRSCSYRL